MDKLLTKTASGPWELSLEDMEELGVDFCSGDLKNINKIYSIIQVTGDDILLTLADTKEKVSVNELVKFWRENK